MLILRMYRERPSLFLDMCAKNCTEKMVRMGEIRPIEVDADRGDSLFLGEGLDAAKIYRDSNNLCASVVRDLKDNGVDGQEPEKSLCRRGEEWIFLGTCRRSGWLELLFNPQSQTASPGGFVTVGEERHPVQEVAPHVWKVGMVFEEKNTPLGGIIEQAGSYGWGMGA